MLFGVKEGVSLVVVRVDVGFGGYWKNVLRAFWELELRASLYDSKLCISNLMDLSTSSSSTIWLS